MVVLLSALMFLGQAPAAAQDTCTLEGTVKLTDASGAALAASDAVVYLKDGPPRLRPEPATHVVRQREKQFHPRSLVLMVNDRVNFVNEDKGLEHSVFANRWENAFLGDVNARSTTYQKSFTSEGHTHVQCNIHKEMTLDVLVLRSAAFTRPDEQGAWKLTGLERRAYTLVVWEPTGATESRQVTCGATAPVALELVQKKRPTPRRRDGSLYPEYQN